MAGRRIRRTSVLAAILLAAVATAAVAQTQPTSCDAGRRPERLAELLFGRGGHPGVSNAAWKRFLDREITPRFPDGLTVTDAAGQWRDPATGSIVREKSKRVEIVLFGHGDNQARLDAVAAAYKRQFHQRSVGIIIESICVSF